MAVHAGDAAFRSMIYGRLGCARTCGASHGQHGMQVGQQDGAAGGGVALRRCRPSGRGGVEKERGHAGSCHEDRSVGQQVHLRIQAELLSGRAGEHAERAGGGPVVLDRRRRHTVRDLATEDQRRPIGELDVARIPPGHLHVGAGLPRPAAGVEDVRLGDADALRAARRVPTREQDVPVRHDVVAGTEDLTRPVEVDRCHRSGHRIEDVGPAPCVRSAAFEQQDLAVVQQDRVDARDRDLERRRPTSDVRGGRDGNLIKAGCSRRASRRPSTTGPTPPHDALPLMTYSACIVASGGNQRP